MSGVNGGIDYDIDLTTLPAPLASRIRTIQKGPDSPTQLISAAHEIAAASRTTPAILPVLVDMLGFNNPVAANIAIDALANAGKSSVPSLLRGVAAFNYSVNAYALRALARIADPSVLDVAIACAVKGPIPNVRRAAVRALASLKYEGREQAACAMEQILRLADAEQDWGVRYAAIAALEAFQSLHLVDDDMIQVAVTVVQSAAKGTSGVYVEDAAEVPEDATVCARASIALEVLETRVRASAGVQ